MAQLTDYGKAVRHKLIDEGKSQSWLREQILENTGLKVDSSYLTNILTGNRVGKRVKAAINEILQIET